MTAESSTWLPSSRAPAFIPRNMQSALVSVWTSMIAGSAAWSARLSITHTHMLGWERVIFSPGSIRRRMMSQKGRFGQTKGKGHRSAHSKIKRKEVAEKRKKLMTSWIKASTFLALLKFWCILRIIHHIHMLRYIHILKERWKTSNLPKDISDRIQKASSRLRESLTKEEGGQV